MNEFHEHLPECPFQFAPLDVCDCVEKRMAKRIAELNAEVERLNGLLNASPETMTIRFMAEQLLRKDVEALLDEIAEARKYAVTATVEGNTMEVMSVEDVDAAFEKWERRNA